ncbi:MAG: RDD family protein [Candidatus Poribacteria bacterium]|nr:RDD family protein [Candidatus Poribacteria bacterium]
MNEQLSVETPEQIEINYQKAGVGSRFYAALLDTLLLALILFVGTYVNINFIMQLGDVFGKWLGALGGIIIFAILWSYYIVFEITTNGQSPGKRALGLRVIKEGGYPISFTDSAIRNLVRVVDFLPVCYGVGLFVMLINKDWQRLGDLAAGTLVVKTAQSDIKLTSATLNASTSPINITTQENLYIDWIQPELVTDSDFDMIREYLGRRADLSSTRRFELSRTIGKPIAEKMGGEGTIRYDRFLEEVYTLKTKDQS